MSLRPQNVDFSAQHGWNSAKSVSPNNIVDNNVFVAHFHYKNRNKYH